MKILFIIIISLSGLLSQDMGYKMYKNGDIESALKYYKQLVNVDNENLSNEELLYNIGTIYAQMDSASEASSIFEEAYQDSSGYSSELSYNYGNTLYRSQKLEESLKAFRETLLKNPDDLDARKNYEFVKNEIERNKSMQKKKDKSKKSDEEESDEDKEKKKKKKDDSQNDKSNNKEDKNDPNNNDNGPTDNQNSKSPDQQNEQNREIQSKQSAENILNAIKENEKVNKKRKQTNYNNESGKDW